jgi:hypothetical protein
MTSNMRQSAALLGLILGTIAGCAEAAGPVFGDWRGTQPSGAAQYSKMVELVLNGPPDAQSGTYRIATTEYNPGALSGNGGTRRWGDAWTSEQRVVDGRKQMIIHLHNTLPGDLSTYELGSDGSLHVVDPNGQVDRTPAAKLYVLSPVQQGPRYGRD